LDDCEDSQDEIQEQIRWGKAMTSQNSLTRPKKMINSKRDISHDKKLTDRSQGNLYTE